MPFLKCTLKHILAAGPHRSAGLHAAARRLRRRFRRSKSGRPSRRGRGLPGSRPPGKLAGVTPATHVAVAAAVGTQFRQVAAALAVSFGLHFVLDFFFHFEGFFPLSVPGGWTYERAMLWLFVGLGALVVPALLWALWKKRMVGLFGGYALLMCLLPFENVARWRLLWSALLSASGGGSARPPKRDAGSCAALPVTCLTPCGTGSLRSTACTRLCITGVRCLWGRGCRCWRGATGTLSLTT